MIIPKYFKDKAIGLFGEKGLEWIEDLPSIIDRSIEKWDLRELSVVDGLTVNFICYGKSPKYGDIVLKIGGPHSEKYTEMKALSLYGGNGICKCYESDMNLGAMILERIKPGNTLADLDDINKKLIIGADLITKLPIKVYKNHGLPTYYDWTNRAFNRAKRENKVGDKMFFMIKECEVLIEEIKALNRPMMLLHGDLHHWNILRDSDEGWKAIDPQGVIGVSCMESSRFMQNHLDMVKKEERPKLLDEMTSIFSERFNENKRIIAISLLILYTLSICWSFEEADPDMEYLSEAIETCNMIYNYTKGI